MKKALVALLISVSLPAFAGKMKEIWSMTQESVLDTLGFNEDVVKIEGFQFIQVQDADLAVQTDVVMYYSRDAAPAAFECVTKFSKHGDSYDVIGTQCFDKY